MISDRLFMPVRGVQVGRRERPDGVHVEYRLHDPVHAEILAACLINSVAGVEPEEYIGGRDDPYLIRWHLRRAKYDGNVYLHRIMRSDAERDLHCHPFDNTSIILHGELREILEDGVRILRPGSVTSRRAEDKHRLELVQGEVWSLFITGAKRRDWGFYPDGVFVPWQEYVSRPRT